MPKIYGELQDACLENLSSDPSANTAGRIWNNTTDGKVKTDDGTAKRALLRNDQAAVIGNNGTANNNIRLHRGANETLQFVKGGDSTAEGTLSANLAVTSSRIESALEAGLPAAGNVGRLTYLTDTDTVSYDDGTNWKQLLAQSLATTKGDIIARSSSQLTRLPVGTNNQVLTADSAQTLGVKWATVGTAATSSHSSAYTASIGDGLSFNDVAAGGYTITLPSAVGNNGEKLMFQKIDGSFNAVSIDALTNLFTLFESVTIMSDGTNWNVIDRYIPGLTSAVTFSVQGGFNSITTQASFMRRSGDCAHFNVSIQANVSAATGQFVLPSGLSLNTSKYSSGFTSVGTWWAFGSNNQFGSTARVGAVFMTTGAPTEIKFADRATGTTFTEVGAINSLISSGESWACEFIIPISGWQP